MASGEITITVDDAVIKTYPGKTVLEAATEAGIYIPYLCYHPGMKPFAACRMCVVEVDGGKGYPASCTLPVTEGMVVKNKSEAVGELRKNIAEMLIAEHPNGCLTCHRVELCGPQDICLRHVSVNDRCVTCPKNERCELKDTIRRLGMNLESPLEYRYRNIPIENGDPFYDRDLNLCITCGRCVRVCDEVRGDNALTFTDRSGRALIGTSSGSSLLESGCEFCGACVDVCPVGALVERDNKWEKPKRVERTICPHCPVGCQVNLEVNDSGKIIRSIPELNSPTNHGQACFKGKFGLGFSNGKGRIKKPLIKRNGQLEETSWDECINYISSSLGDHIGPGFAIMSSPDSTNEEHYLTQKFARLVMRSNNVDQTSNSQPEATKKLGEILGYYAATNSIWEIENAECIITFNTNVTEEHNIVSLPIKRAIKQGSKLIVIDPREVELTRHAQMWLRPRPGTELLILGAILKIILEEGLEQAQWLKTYCEDITSLRDGLNQLSIEAIATETGVAQELLEDAARCFASVDASAILYALDNIPTGQRNDCVHSLINLALITGNLGKPSSGLYPMLQGANQQGAFDVGCIPDFLPGYSAISDIASLKNLEHQWGCKIPTERGIGVNRIKDAIETGKIKSLFVVGQNEYLLNVIEHESPSLLEKLDLLIVQETYLTELGKQANVVLPRTTFAEKTGTYTNLERRVQMIKQVIEPRSGEPRSEGWVLCQLAKNMNVSGFDFTTSSEVLDEISKTTHIYAGISRNRLEAEGTIVLRPDPSEPLPNQVLYSDKEYKGLQWPCTEASEVGTPILYSEGPIKEKFLISSPIFSRSQMTLDDNHPFLLTPGRVLLQSERPLSIIEGKPNTIEREELIELHALDAKTHNIHQGDMVKIHSDHEVLHGRAVIRDDAKEGIISTTSLFAQLMVDIESSSDPDPMSKVPGLVIRKVGLIKSQNNGADG